MGENTLAAIIAELEVAEANFKAQVEKLYGKMETTDFSDEYQELVAIHDKLKALATPEKTEA